ncbi:hypothetical protein P9112_008001 [Eukaryota sp. TZLM1-RC]
MENQRALKPTVITVDPRESTSVARYPQVAPYLQHTGREAISQYVEALKVYASRMSSNHVSSDMARRYPSSTHSQSPSGTKASESSSCDSDREAIKARTQEVAALKSRLSLTENSELSTEDTSESTPVSTRTRKPSSTLHPRNFKLPSEMDFEESQDPPSDSSDTTNVATFEKRRLVSENQLHQVMLPYVLCTIAPIVLETFEIFEGIDPNDPEAVLSHLLSFCRFEDSAEAYHKLQSLRLNLSAPIAEEAITSYISAFLKKLRLCPSELPESARMKFFTNGIRPERLRFIIRTDVETGSIDSFSSLVSRLRQLLPSYHLPYSAYCTLHGPNPPPPRSHPSRQNSRTPQAHRSANKSYSVRSTPKSSPSRQSPRSEQKYFSPQKSPSPITCFYCKEPGHMVKDCPKPGCKASKPRKYGNNPTLQRKHNLRRQVNQVTDANPEEPQVNSIIDSIQSALEEDTAVESIFPHGVMSSSSSSSDNDSYSVTLNPFSSINLYNYSTSPSTSRSSTPSLSFSEAQEFQELFDNLDSIAPPFSDTNHALIPRSPSTYSEPSSNPMSNSSESASKVSSSLSHVVPPGKAPSRNIDSLSLEANPDLDTESGLVDADCAYADGGVTHDASEFTKKRSKNETKGSKELIKKDDSLAKPMISIFEKELNKPVDKKLLHLKILVDEQTFLYGMVDTGATISCISEDLTKKAKLQPTNNSLEVGLADRTKVVCPLVSGKLAFSLGGAAKLTFIDVTLAVLPCQNSCIIGCDLLKRLGILTDEYLFLNLSDKNYQLMEDESIPDLFIPPSDRVSALSALPDLDKTSFLLNDLALETSIKDLLFKYPEVFSKLPAPEGIDCPPMRIPFHDESKIVSKKFRYLPPDKLKVANEEMDVLVNNGFAVPYDGPWSSPICLVQRPGKPPRLTGDYSGAGGINDLTVPVPADLPKISDVCEFLSGNKYIATLDLPKAFWQLNLHPDDQEKSAIAIPGRKIKNTRAAFGLKNVPAVFQNLMKDYILSRARRYRVRIGLHKCSFQTDRHPIKILGTIFEDGKRRIDPSKIETVRNLAPPTSVPELRSFTGSINFLRDWLPSVSKELAPLTALLKNKPKRIKLGPQELQCFNNIKEMVINSLPLALPDPDDTILVSTDASDKAIAGIVWKELEPCPPGTCLSKRKVMPVSFYSRILTPSQQRWSTLQKELFAIVMTLNQPNLSSYLLTKHLKIFCDHKNLAYLFSCPDNNRVVLRWIPVLQSFSFDCVHIEGTKNYWADYLSRANYVETASKKKKKKRRRPEVPLTTLRPPCAA